MCEGGGGASAPNAPLMRTSLHLSLSVVPLSVRKPPAASKQSSALIGIYASTLASSGGWASSNDGGASSMGSLMVKLLQSSSGLLTFTLMNTYVPGNLY